MIAAGVLIIMNTLMLGESSATLICVPVVSVCHECRAALLIAIIDENIFSRRGRHRPLPLQIDAARAADLFRFFLIAAPPSTKKAERPGILMLMASTSAGGATRSMPRYLRERIERRMIILLRVYWRRDTLPRAANGFDATPSRRVRYAAGLI